MKHWAYSYAHITYNPKLRIGNELCIHVWQKWSLKITFEWSSERFSRSICKQCVKKLDLQVTFLASFKVRTYVAASLHAFVLYSSRRHVSSAQVYLDLQRVF